MVKRKYLLFLLLPIFILSACSSKTNLSDNSWEEEVLFASECGHDGLQCCLNEDVLCLYEQECCIDPNDPNSTYCADTCDFGKENTFCRDINPQCDEGAVCYESYCRLAGGDSQPCFLDGACREGSVCGNGICVECGLAGNPCCENNKFKCKNENNSDNARTDCIAGICQDCGYASKLVCSSEPNCNSGHLQNNNTCLLCGGYNQPCCRSLDNDIPYCDDEDNFGCQSGFCLKNN